MSERKERQYEVEGGKTSPFAPSKAVKETSSADSEHVPGHPSKKKPAAEPRGPYGSIWGLQHLNWLHLHFALGHDWEELFSPESKISQSGKIAIHLQQRLGAEWKWICETNHDDSLSIYAFFQRLIYERKEDDDWRTATHVSTDSSSPSSSKSHSSRHSISPQQNRQGMLSRQGMYISDICPRIVTATGITVMVQGPKRVHDASVLVKLVFQT